MARREQEQGVLGRGGDLRQGEHHGAGLEVDERGVLAGQTE